MHLVKSKYGHSLWFPAWRGPITNCAPKCSLLEKGFHPLVSVQGYRIILTLKCSIFRRNERHSKVGEKILTCPPSSNPKKTPLELKRGYWEKTYSQGRAELGKAADAGPGNGVFQPEERSPITSQCNCEAGSHIWQILEPQKGYGFTPVNPVDTAGLYSW